MVAQTKRNKAIREKIEAGKLYAVDDALSLASVLCTRSTAWPSPREVQY